MLRPLNPTTCHCHFSESPWFIMSQSQWQCFPCEAALPPSRLGVASLSVLAPRPIFVPSINQLMVLGSKLSLLKIGSDFLGLAQLNSWFPFIRSLCWHRQLPLQIGQVLEKSTLGSSPLLGSWWSPVSWQPNRPSTSRPILEKDVSL